MIDYELEKLSMIASPQESSRSKIWLAGVLIAVVGIVLWGFAMPQLSGLRTFRLVSGSMEKTIYKDDVIVADLHAYRRAQVGRGDVITFNHDGNVLLKRVIGLPGDQIFGTDGSVSVNGKILSEPYAEHTDTAREPFDEFGPVTVPAGQLFLLGDNRDFSLDSRLPEFGAVHLNEVTGRALFVLASEHNRAGTRIR